MSTLVATYAYPGPKGEHRIVKWRYEPKEFRMGSYTHTSERTGKPQFAKRIRDEAFWWSQEAMYRLPQRSQGLKLGDPIFSTEGEKDADALTSMGVVATSHWQGSAEFAYGQAQWFTKYSSRSPVYIVVDNDNPGAWSGWLRYQRLTEAGVDPDRIRVIAPPWDRRHLKDAHDAVVGRGLSLSAFRSVRLGSLRSTAEAYTCARAARYTTADPAPGSGAS